MVAYRKYRIKCEETYIYICYYLPNFFLYFLQFAWQKAFKILYLLSYRTFYFYGDQVVSGFFGSY